MIDEPLFYIIAVPAVLLAGISKGGFGGGLGILTMPALALVIPPLQAAGIMLPILCLMDLFGLWAYRNIWDRRSMAVLVPAAVLGIGLGTLSAGTLDDQHIRLIVGTIALIFAADYWIGRRSAASPRPRNPWKGGFWGVVAGFTSFIAHAGGPPVSVYLLPLKLDKTLFVGTTVVFFFVVNYVKLVPYAWLGQLHVGNLLTALALAPLAPLGIYAGVRLHKRVSPKVFYEVAYAFVLLVGLKLVYDGLGLARALG